MVNGKISIFKKTNGEVHFPVTSADAVFMGDGHTTVREEIDSKASNNDLLTVLEQVNNNVTDEKLSSVIENKVNDGTIAGLTLGYNSIDSEKCNFLEKEVFKIIKFSDMNVINNKFLNADDTVVDSAIFGYTDYTLIQGDILEFSYFRSVNFYDMNKNLITNITVSTGQNNYSIIIPTGAVYVRANINKTNIDNQTFTIKLKNNNTVSDTLTLSEDDVKKDYYVDSNFNLVAINGTSYCLTKEIDLPSNVKECYVAWHIRTVFYDENMIKIGTFSTALSNKETKIEIPLNARKLVTCFDYNILSSYYIKFVYKYTSKLSNEIMITEENFPFSLESLKTKSKWHGKKGISGGDSIMWQDGNAYSSGNEQGVIAEGYQTHLKKHLGFLAFDNVAVSGKAMTDKGGEGTNTTMKKITNYSEYDLCLINAGTNDLTLGSLLGKLEKIGTEFRLNTFYGAYQDLIEYILSKNPKIRIILMTPLQRSINGKDIYWINSTDKSYYDYVNAVIEIGKLYSIPVARMDSESGLNLINIDTLTRDGLHPNNLGYKYICENYLIDFINNH